MTITNINNAPTLSLGNGVVSTQVGINSYGYATDVFKQTDGKIIVAGSISGVIALVRYNSDGSLDGGFGKDGVVFSGLDSYSAGLGSVALQQPDGKIVIAGSTYDAYGRYDLILERYNPDGTLDDSFSNKAIPRTELIRNNEYAFDVAIQQDGKIVVSGASINNQSDILLLRYNADGSLDTSFAKKGYLTFDNNGLSDFASNVNLQADGKILVAGRSEAFGSSSILLQRFNSNGSLDTNFSFDKNLGFGATRDSIVQPDGKILVLTDNKLIRFNSNGSLDKTFASNEYVPAVEFDPRVCFTLLKDGKILIIGRNGHFDRYGNEGMTLFKFNSDGTRDLTFSDDGRFDLNISSNYNYSNQLQVQDNGQILVVGRFDQAFGLFRLNADGSLDTSFGSPTIAYTENQNVVSLGWLVNVYDPELSSLGNFDGASITLTRNGGANAEDTFSSLSSVDVSFSNLAEGSDLVLNGSLIVGQVKQNSQGTLQILFNENATQSNVSQLLSSFGYSNNSDHPPSSVELDWVFSDGNTGEQGTGGAMSTTRHSTVIITSVNDSPTGQVKLIGDAIEGQTLKVDLSEFKDLDGIGSLSYIWKADGAYIYGANGSSFTLTQDQVGKSVQVMISYTDGSGNAERVVSNSIIEVIEGNESPKFVTMPQPGFVYTTMVDKGEASLTGLVVLPNGKIMATGDTKLFSDEYDVYRQAQMVRYNSDGSLDKTFGEQGKVQGGYGDTYESAVTPDGNVALVGSYSRNFQLQIVHPNGQFTIGGADIYGNSYDSSDSVAVQSNGKIVTAGFAYTSNSYDIAIVRYNKDGSLDTSFSKDGKVTTDFARNSDDDANAILVQPNGKILVAGSSGNAIALLRYNNDGSLDSSFSGDGKVKFQLSKDPNSFCYAEGMALQANGNILVVANGALIRFKSNGTVDTSFSGDGIVTNSNLSVKDVSIQANGKILVAGYAGDSLGLAVARYNSNGTLDTSFSDDGMTTVKLGAENYGIRMAIQSDGKILVGTQTRNEITGLSEFALARLNSNGDIDETFTGDGLNSSLQPYNENSAPIALGTSVSLTDPELSMQGNYSGATITLKRPDGANDEDVFSNIDNSLSSFIEGSDLVLSGSLTVGQVKQNSQGILQILFNENATQSVLNQVLSSFGYSNKSDLPSHTVELEWIFNDGNTGEQGPGGAMTAIGHTSVRIIAANASPTGELKINGNMVEGQMLTADLSALYDSNGLGSMNYQWKVNGKLIKGEVNETYQLKHSDIGKLISLSLSYIDDDGYSENLTSQAGVKVRALNELIQGSSGDDSLDGGLGRDTLSGGLGNDTYKIDINSLGRQEDTVKEAKNAGVDTIELRGVSINTHATTITMPSNVEFLDASATGASLLNFIGNSQSNKIIGNDAKNLIQGGFGGDILDGGDGGDIYIVSTVKEYSGDVIQDKGTIGTDELRFVSKTAETLVLSSTLVGVENIVLGTGFAEQAILTSKVSLNVDASNVNYGLGVIGNSGKNIILGTTFSDSIVGGAGNDILSGGGGSDTLMGGIGDDVFKFNRASTGSDEFCSIIDFEHLHDSLQLSKSIFSGLIDINSDLTSNEFIAIHLNGGFVQNTDLSDDHRIIYDTDSGNLYYDKDGSGENLAVKLAQLISIPSIDESDFLIAP